MKTFEFYIDQKFTAWRRYSVSVEAETLEDARQIIIGRVNEDLDAVKEDAWDEETLYDTMEPMLPEENGGSATVEVMEPETYNSIHDNSKPEGEGGAA